MNTLRIAVGSLVLALCAAGATAGTITATNGTQTGSADITLGATSLSITLRNETAVTSTSVDLLTGFGFTLTDASGLSLDDADAAQSINVLSTGAFTTLGAVDLLDYDGNGNATWELKSLGSDYYELRFNPNAEYAIIGKPTNGDYSGSNGGIKTSPGHNPFTYYTADFELSFTGSSAAISAPVFLFGTDFSVKIVPLPSAAWAGLALLGVIGMIQVVRRRRRATAI